jgi:hypothetical protein
MFTRVSEEERETLFTPEHFTTSSDVEREKFVSLFCVLFPNTSTNDRRERVEIEERKKRGDPTKKKSGPLPKKDTVILVERNQKIYRSARCEHFRHKTTHVL